MIAFKVMEARSIKPNCEVIEMSEVKVPVGFKVVEVGTKDMRNCTTTTMMNILNNYKNHSEGIPKDIVTFEKEIQKRSPKATIKSIERTYIPRLVKHKAIMLLEKSDMWYVLPIREVVRKDFSLKK